MTGIQFKNNNNNSKYIGQSKIFDSIVKPFENFFYLFVTYIMFIPMDFHSWYNKLQIDF